MKLAFLVRYLYMGGAERQAVELAHAMSERGHDVSIFTFYSGGELLEEARSRGVNVMDLNRSGWWDFIYFVARLARQLRQHRPDVIYSFGAIPNLVAVLVRPFISRCTITWGIRNNMTYQSPIWFAKLMMLAMPRLSSCTDLIIANSHDGRSEALRQGFNATNFYVLSNCINTQRFVPSNSLRETFRKQFGIASGDVLIGVVGIRAGKGTTDFLHAAASLSCGQTNLRYLIVGHDAACSPTLSQMINKLGLRDRAICLNTQTDIVSVYNAIDLLCSASHGEGFPNVIAEAMSCGTPCVVTDVGESAAIVGPHGIMVPPGDPKSLANALASAVVDLNRFGEHETIRRRIVQEYSTKSVARKTEELLQTSSRS